LTKVDSFTNFKDSFPGNEAIFYPGGYLPGLPAGTARPGRGFSALANRAGWLERCATQQNSDRIGNKSMVVRSQINPVTNHPVYAMPPWILRNKRSK
jgi:hypothetical protein